MWNQNLALVQHVWLVIWKLLYGKMPALKLLPFGATIRCLVLLPSFNCSWLQRVCESDIWIEIWFVPNSDWTLLVIFVCIKEVWKNFEYQRYSTIFNDKLPAMNYLIKNACPSICLYLLTQSFWWSRISLLYKLIFFNQKSNIVRD